MGMRKRCAIALALIIAVVLTGVYIMPHGYPPWSGVKKQTVFSLPIDMGELAARLGSIVTFDRRGDVIWLEDFENGLNKWVEGTTFANAEVYLSAVSSFRGAYACAIVTSDQADGYTYLTRDFQPAVLGQVGVEITYQISDVEVDFDLGISHYTGSDEYAYRVKHDTSANKLYYYHRTAGWTEVLADVYGSTYPTAWNTMKLVVDLADEEYVRVVFNDQEASLKALTCPHTTIGADPGLNAIIRVHGDTDATYTAYLDNVILTQNEP